MSDWGDIVESILLGIGILLVLITLLFIIPVWLPAWLHARTLRKESQNDTATLRNAEQGISLDKEEPVEHDYVPPTGTPDRSDHGAAAHDDRHHRTTARTMTVELRPPSRGDDSEESNPPHVVESPKQDPNSLPSEASHRLESTRTRDFSMMVSQGETANKSS